MEQALMQKQCSHCGSTSRPYGSDIFSGADGGLYYRLCERCQKVFGFNKDTHDKTLDVSLEDYLVLKTQRERTGRI